MDRKYKKELIELKTKPTEQINGIYIIPYKEYNGFWVKLVINLLISFLKIIKEKK